MKIFSFLIASIIYILCVMFIIFAFHFDDFTLDSVFFSYSMPVYLWIGLILGIYAAFSIIHMIFYGFKFFISQKSINSDKNKFKKYTQDILFANNSNISFRSSHYIKVKEILNAIVFKQSDDKKIEEILLIQDRINSGEYVEDLNKFNLDKNNIFYVKNEENKAKIDLNYAKKVLKNKSQLNTSLEKKAFENILNNGNLNDILSFDFEKSDEEILLIFSRFDSEILNPETVLKLFSSLKQDFIKAIKILCVKINPTSLLAILKKLQDEDEKYSRAYFYTLAYFGDFDELLLQNSQKKYDDFKVVLVLRDNGVKFCLEDIIK